MILKQMYSRQGPKVQILKQYAVQQMVYFIKISGSYRYYKNWDIFHENIMCMNVGQYYFISFIYYLVKCCCNCMLHYESNFSLEFIMLVHCVKSRRPAWDGYVHINVGTIMYGNQ